MYLSTGICQQSQIVNSIGQNPSFSTKLLLGLSYRFLANKWLIPLFWLSTLSPQKKTRALKVNIPRVWPLFSLPGFEVWGFWLVSWGFQIFNLRTIVPTCACGHQLFWAISVQHCLKKTLWGWRMVEKGPWLKWRVEVPLKITQRYR